MAYAFEDKEPVSVAIPRVMLEQLARVREHLTADEPIDERVHDARKRFKETRALLRLIRKPLGAQFEIENVWFRDAARELAAARDADAVLEALAKLKLPRGIRPPARRALEARRHPETGVLAENMGTVLEQIVIAGHA